MPCGRPKTKTPEQTKERVQKYHRERWLARKEELSKEYTCECGKVIQMGNRWAHFKSKGHLQTMEMLRKRDECMKCPIETQ